MREIFSPPEFPDAEQTGNTHSDPCVFNRTIFLFSLEGLNHMADAGCSFFEQAFREVHEQEDAWLGGILSLLEEAPPDVPRAAAARPPAGRDFRLAKDESDSGLPGCLLQRGLPFGCTACCSEVVPEDSSAFLLQEQQQQMYRHIALCSLVFA